MNPTFPKMTMYLNMDFSSSVPFTDLEKIQETKRSIPYISGPRKNMTMAFARSSSENSKFIDTITIAGKVI